MEKVKPFKHISFYYSYNTCSLCSLASFPSLDHQTHGPETSLPFWHPTSVKKLQKGTQSGSQEPPKMTLKSIKMHTWTSKCLLGDPLDPWITKMVSQVPKMEPQGHHNVSFEHKK